MAMNLIAMGSVMLPLSKPLFAQRDDRLVTLAVAGTLLTATLATLAVLAALTGLA